MKGLITTMGLAVAMAAAGPLAADEVNSADINQFSAGSPASASQVNQNFAALISAINDNAQRIGTLEGLSAASVAGSQYQLRGIGMLFRGDTSTGYASMGNYSQAYTLTFDATNGFTLIGQENEGEVDANNGDATRVQNNGAVSMSGSWSQNGNQVTLTTTDTTFTVVVTSDGSVVLSNDFNFGLDSATTTASESSMTIGVRQDGGPQ